MFSGGASIVQADAALLVVHPPSVQATRETLYWVKGCRLESREVRPCPAGYSSPSHRSEYLTIFPFGIDGMDQDTFIWWALMTQRTGGLTPDGGASGVVMLVGSLVQQPPPVQARTA